MGEDLLFIPPNALAPAHGPHVRVHARFSDGAGVLIDSLTVAENLLLSLSHCGHPYQERWVELAFPPPSRYLVANLAVHNFGS